MRTLVVLTVICASCSRAPETTLQPVSMPDVSVLAQPTAREQEQQKQNRNHRDQPGHE